MNKRPELVIRDYNHGNVLPPILILLFFHPAVTYICRSQTPGALILNHLSVAKTTEKC